MPVRYSEQLPVEALRDLVAIGRVLCAQLSEQRGDPVALQELVEIGKLLAGVLDDAVRTPAGSLGHRVGWDRAQQGVQRLSLLVAESASLRPFVLKASERVTGGRASANRRAEHRRP
jgi:hypothetical protein